MLGFFTGLFAAALILGSPFAGQIRAALASAFPADFVRIVGSLIALAVGGAFVVALVQRRPRRWLRLAMLSSALALGVGVAVALRTGTAAVDVVERFHFVEYGMFTVLCYRLWRSRNDASMWALPMLMGLLVAVLDEWLQWFLPSRVGEFHDVLLDAASCACGLLFSFGLDPPDRFGTLLSLAPGSRARIGASGSVVAIALGSFFQAVHLGYLVVAPPATAFLSTFSSEELIAASRDRMLRWRLAPPVVPRLLAREDHYMSEALWHVQGRNAAWSSGDFAAAWEENRILETFFLPVLTTPSFYGKSGQQWPASQRADAEMRARGAPRAYVSRAEPYAIHTWPKWIVWMATLAGAVGFALWGRDAAQGARPR